MEGFMTKESLLKYRTAQVGIVEDAKECAAAAWTQESKNIRLETVELEVKMLNVLEDLLEDHRRLDLLLTDMGFKLKEFNPDGASRKVKAIDIGGNEKTFNYEFTKDTLRISSEFGRLIQERNLWSNTFNKNEVCSND